MISGKNSFFKKPLMKERLYLLAIFVVMAVAYHEWFYLPVHKRIAGIASEMEKVSGEVNAYRTIVTGAKAEALRLDGLVKAYEEMKRAAPAADVSTSDISGIFREISAPHPGITVLSIQNGEREDRGDYVKLPITVQIRGDFLSFGRYLSKMGSSGRMIGVERVAITAEPGPDLSITLGLSAYLPPGKI